MAFGITMMMNVWMRIWPAQRKIIAAIKEGTARSGARQPRGSTFASQHLHVRAASHVHVRAALRRLLQRRHRSPRRSSPLVMVFVTAALGFFVANLLYKKAGQLTGA
jgi:hypothetical protein